MSGVSIDLDTRILRDGGGGGISRVRLDVRGATNREGFDYVLTGGVDGLTICGDPQQQRQTTTKQGSWCCEVA